MAMWQYVGRRVFFAIVTVFVAITLNFFLFRVLPGDAVRDMARVPHASPELINELRRDFGLDKSLTEQYFAYLQELARGNMGVSFVDKQPVVNNLFEALGNTVPMVLVGTLLAIVLGIGAGLIAAWWRGTAAGSATTAVAIFFYSAPAQWLALVLLLWFAGVLPTHGMSDPYLVNPSLGAQLLDIGRHMALPSLTMMLIAYGEYALVVRSALLESLGEDYVLTARAKGLTPRRILRSYALRNAMLPTATLIGLSLGNIVGGAILLETVFSWPGIGYATYQSVIQRDYPMLQGSFLILTVSVVLFNLLTDLLYFRLDP
ncbi:MAG: ABC transporter permease, partial [Brevibacterium aurantiacum]|nr:ABC transporter permease [Brevibacterium aurantiacum]